MPAVPFCTITSESAWISMADAGCDTENKNRQLSAQSKRVMGLDMSLGKNDKFKSQLVKTTTTLAKTTTCSDQWLLFYHNQIYKNHI